MKLLVKNERNVLIAVALNLTERTLPVLDNLIKMHSLEVVSYSPDPEMTAFYGPLQVTVGTADTPFQSLTNVKFTTIEPTQQQWSVWFNALALLYVNRRILEIRASWSKSLPYQSEAYAIKLDEAKLVDGMAQEDLGDPASVAPMLHAEASSRNVQIADQAKAVLAADVLHRQSIVQSEILRTQFNSRAYSVSTLSELVSFRNEFDQLVSQ